MKHGAIVTLVAVVFFALSGLGFGGGPDIKEGQWQVTVVMKIPGMPMQMPPRVQTRCITKDNPMPQKGPVQGCSECKVVDNSIHGNTVSWVVECNSREGKVRSDGKITYSGATFTGKAKITQGGMVMWQDLSGKWTGPCK